jgi:hypothetical protein
MTHFHTCTDCGTKTLCNEAVPTEWTGRRGAPYHPPDCVCVQCDVHLACTGSDGDGRCGPCAVTAFDAIGTDRRYRCSE